MKNKMITAAIAAFAFTAILSSCKKTAEDDKTAPTLTITHPTASDTMSASGGIHIMATMGDNDDLHEASVSLVAGVDTFLMAAPYVHELSTYTYDTTVVGTSATLRQATLKIHVEDHHENMTDKSVTFYIKP